MKKTFGVIGGDLRQAYLAGLLAEDGQTVTTCGLSQWDGTREAPLPETAAAEVILLPLPLCREEGCLNSADESVSTGELFRLFSPEQVLLAGQIRPAQRREAEALGLSPEDYFLREELQVANAVPTAEGAVQIAMEQMPVTLCGTECLVLGYGRIGRLLAHRLSGLEARVTVAARKHSDLAWARAFGLTALQSADLTGHLGRFQAVFNTVPSLILDRGLLNELPKTCLCIDVASQQGLDFAAAEELGIQAVWARSLPGRMSPRTAAAAIRDTVYHILEERGESV